MTPEDLAFEAGWRAGYERGKRSPFAELSHQDGMATADWRNYRASIAQPDRCGCCGAMNNTGSLCSACRVSD